MPWGPFPQGSKSRDRKRLSRFAIRQPARAVQRNWAAANQFDKRATDPYQPARAQVAELVDALASGASGLTAVKVRVLSWAPLSMPKPRSPTSFRCSDPHQQLHSLLGASKRFEVAVGSRQQQRAFKLAQHHGRGEIRIARRHAEA